MNKAAVLLWIATACAAQAGDAVYKSVGPDGKVTYSQTPPQSGTVRKMAFDNLPASPLPEHVLKFRQEMEKNIAQKQQAAVAPVQGLRLFSAKWCVYCRHAKAWLGSKGIAYAEVDIDTPQGMAEFAATGAAKSVPLLVGPGVRLQGFSEEAYASAMAAQRR
jgi:glutaredoxin